ncbi:MAG: 3-deoxy-D-manno-octulosonic acid kinase [Gammaproteobacteria bacterium]|nr:MAG: 3-deoxy-D-manno-octulosonic acid kinase [Gammaproteobacteria bacterium]
MTKSAQEEQTNSSKDIPSQNKVAHYQDSRGHYIILPSINNITLSDINSRWFDPSYWQAKDRITGQSKGRNITWFLKAPEKAADMDWALRHYYRGGLVSKLSNDRYFFNGLTKTRAYREVSLLQQMIELDLPVPKPIAARVIKNGLSYSADLLMEKLAGIDLVHKLKSDVLSPETWESIGKTIADFHKHGIYHADLNAHNILIGEDDSISIIDFDRCNKRQIQSMWQRNNIKRLERSFLKERGLDNSINFYNDDWISLKKGYAASLNRNNLVE